MVHAYLDAGGPGASAGQEDWLGVMAWGVWLLAMLPLIPGVILMMVRALR